MVAQENLYLSSLFGGAMAGLFVDISLFPLDTIKTRLQSQQGFSKAGGFRGIYRGIGPQVVGSAPQAAAFFCTYEMSKLYMQHHVNSPHVLPAVHMLAASLGEMVACIIRVPMEVVKQRRQVSLSRSSMRILIDAYHEEGFRKGLYRGYGSTIMREIPFAIIQFPLYEYFKTLYQRILKNNSSLESYEVAMCGAMAGGIAAGLTTPIDVIKTRIMLAEKRDALNISLVFRNVYKERGIGGLFAGFTPRVLWITIGGYIFFGVYDFSKNVCNDFLLSKPMNKAKY